MPMSISTRLRRNLKNLASLVLPAVSANAMGQLALAAVVAVDKRDRAELVVNTAAITPAFGCLSLRQRAHSSLLLVKIITGHESRTAHYSKRGIIRA
jgi:hypothetical protein